MRYKLPLAIVLALIVVAGGYFVWHDKAKAPTSASSSSAATSSYSWSFKSAGTNEAGNPQTVVSLNGRIVGTYEGSCSTIESSGWTLVSGEQSGAICYFAGGGTEIGVFNGVVKLGTIEEGSAETPGFRGHFTTLFSL